MNFTQPLDVPTNSQQIPQGPKFLWEETGRLEEGHGIDMGGELRVLWCR